MIRLPCDCEPTRHSCHMRLVPRMERPDLAAPFERYGTFTRAIRQMGPDGLPYPPENSGPTGTKETDDR